MMKKKKIATATTETETETGSSFDPSKRGRCEISLVIISQSRPVINSTSPKNNCNGWQKMINHHPSSIFNNLHKKKNGMDVFFSIKCKEAWPKHAYNL